MIRPVTIVVAIAVAVGAAGAVGERHQVVVGDAERAEFSESCERYELRAGPARRGAPGEFVIFLADACAAAETSLDNGTVEQRFRAAMLLSRIALLRETIGQMNADRWARAGGAGMPSPVTPSGEFLIAHRLGLMIAYDAWLDSGVDFSLAFYQ